MEPRTLPDSDLDSIADSSQTQPHTGIHTHIPGFVWLTHSAARITCSEGDEAKPRKLDCQQQGCDDRGGVVGTDKV